MNSDRPTTASGSTVPRGSVKTRAEAEQDTVLVVDDHRAMRRLVRRMVLDALPHVDVREAPDAETAIAALDEFRPSLVLMDVHLPDMDGLEATRRILGRFPGTGVIVMSLTEDWRYYRLAAEAGAAAYLPKAHLLDALPELLMRHHASAA